jgi:DNA-binding CsgD family transcriptional regulator
MPTTTHGDVFTILDRIYGLIDGSTTWHHCLQALVSVAELDASRLLLYDCARGESRVVEAAGIRIERGRPVQHIDIDDVLWRSIPGSIWQPPRAGNAAERLVFGYRVFGCTVLDRDNAHILYLELLQRASATVGAERRMQLLEAVLPHLHRASRLHRSITGDDLFACIASDFDQPTPPVGLPIELRLRRRFKLSKAEARVATLLADGLAPRTIADRLNVSIHTVRSQLQAIFNKTDTSRQAELTSLILRETELPRAVYQSNHVGQEGRGQPPCP